MSNEATALIPVTRIEQQILLLRGEKVMLDSDLAELYGVETKALNQAVQRNLDRFPSDFMFQLSTAEADAVLRSQGATLNAKSRGSINEIKGSLTSQIVTSKPGRGGRRYLPTHADLARKLEALERKYDKQFRGVFDAIRELMSEKKVPRREIGFHVPMPSRRPTRNKKLS